MLNLQVTVLIHPSVRSVLLLCHSFVLWESNGQEMMIEIILNGYLCHFCVDSWHVCLHIGNVLALKHPLSATIRELFHHFRVKFL
jgi:hypothetical protein